MRRLLVRVDLLEADDFSMSLMASHSAGSRLTNDGAIQLRKWTVLCLLFPLAACSDQNKQSQGAAPSAPPQSIGFIVAKRQSVDITTEIAGRVVPSLIAEVRPQVAGIIEKRLFTEGSEVKEGEVLYQIADATYRTSLASARASVDRAAASQVAAKAKADRYQTLANRAVASQQEEEAATAAARQAVADVAAANAAVDAAEINLGYTKVRSPISGKIGVSSLTQGALVTANQQTALATVQALDPVFVDVPQSATAIQATRAEIESGRLKTTAAGVTMRLTLDNGQPYAHEGLLKLTDVTVNQGTGTITLRATFANPQRILLPNMFVRGIATLGSRENVILAPHRAVSRDSRGRATAFVIGAENKIEARKLDVGRSVNNSWIVESGLNEGERLVMDGFQRIRAGQVVAPVPFEAQAAPAAAPGKSSAEPAKQSK